MNLEDFKRLFEASPIAIAVSRLADGVFVAANDAFLALHGYRRDEVIGHTSGELGLWARPGRRAEVMAKLAAPGDTCRFRHEYRRKSGETGRAMVVATRLELRGQAQVAGFLYDLAPLERSEAAVEHLGERLQLLERAIGAGVFEWDSRAGRIAWSPGQEALYGLPPGGFGGTFEAFLGLVPPEDAPGVEAEWRRLLADGGSFDIEHRIRRADGALRWVMARGTVLRDAAGDLQGAIGINADITRRKEAELALRDREQRLAAATAVSRLTFFAQDADLRYEWLSSPALGLTEAEVLGRTDAEAFGEAIAAPLVALKRRMLATGEGARRELRVEWKGRTGWFDMIVAPRRNTCGEVEGILGAAADITARKEAEIALRASETRLATALKISQLVVFSQDRDLRYTWIANPGFGVSEADVVGRLDAEIMDARDAAHLGTIKRRVLATGRGERHEVRVRRGGEAGWYDLIVEARRDGAGDIVGIVCAAADITARKAAEEDAAEVHRQLARLAARRQDALEAERAALARDVHDQVGAALTGLRLRLEALADGLPCGDDACREDLRRLAREAEAVQKSTREICARLRPPSLDDLGLAETCRWYLRDWAATTGLRAAGRFPPLPAEPPAELAIDLFRVLQELLTNVARHAGASRVSASLSAGRRGLRLRVADDGHGFPAGGGEVGGGLGLAGIRERAARHGGRVRVESGPAGTAVTVAFGPGAAP